MATRPSSAAEPVLRRAVRHARIDESELKSWPPVDEALITDADDLARYRRLAGALEDYAQGKTIAKVLEKAKVGRRRFFRLIQLCRAVSKDGRANGMKALVERSCIRTPVRTTNRNEDADLKETAGYGGLFRKLLRDHGQIEPKLVAVLRRKGRYRLSPNTLNFRLVHRAFIKICEEEGLTENDYPLNTRSQGRTPLRRWLKTDFMQRHAVAWFAAEVGPGAAQAAAYGQGSGRDTVPEPPYSAWQIDEQTIDAPARYDLIGDTGEIHSVEVERFQVIRVVALNGPNLAWSMILARQVAAADLIAVLWDAVNGQAPARQVVPGLSYQAGGGFPANVLEELRFAVPSVIYLDNALSHLAEALQRLILDLWGGKVRIGRPGVPQERGKVESDIRLLAQRLFHQLPSTTGSTPRSALRKRAKRDIKHCVDSAQLAHCIDTYLANGNAMPSAGCHYDAPLHWIRRQLEAGRIQPVYLPVAKRCPHLFYPPTIGWVRADMDRGRRPFVNFLGVRYSSDALSKCFNLIGSKFAIRCDPRDLRVIWLYELGSGHEWGPLHALGRWGAFPHDARIRKMFLLFKRKAEWSEGPADEPLERLYAHLREGAPKSRQDATRLAYLMNYLEGWTDAPQAISQACQVWRESLDAANDSASLPLPPPPGAGAGSLPPPDAPNEGTGAPTATAKPTHIDPAPAPVNRVVTFAPIARRRVSG